MTPRYLPVATVARQLGIGPRRLRTLLAAGRIEGAYRMGGLAREKEGQTLEHAEYPHAPGTLYDCSKCESTCYCAPDSTMCVACAIRGPWLIPADYRLTPRRTGPQLRCYRGRA